MTTVALGDIAQINPRLPRKPALDEAVAFLPMASLNTNGTTGAGLSRVYEEVIKGYTPFLDGDLLVAKITPCFQNNKIGQARLRHQVGVGSTEFHVVRPRDAHVDARYLLHFLRRDQVRAEGERRMTGSGGQRRVPAQFLSELRVPLPPLIEQRRIATILDLAEKLEQLMHTVNRQFDHVESAVFARMFRQSASSWPVRPLGELLSTSSGGTPDRSKPENYGGTIPWVKSGELKRPLVIDSEESITEIGLRNSSAKIVAAGTVLVAMYGATAGAVSVLGVPAATNQAVCSMTPGEELTADYLVGALRAMNSVLLAKRAGGAQPNLSQSLLRALPMRLPPLNVQYAYQARLRQLDGLRSSTGRRSGAREMTAALRTRAFTGQL